MGTYVLIHGVSLGGWLWKRLIPFLSSAGHQVYTPTLTGLGERAHLLFPGIGLETHIQDIVGVIRYEDLSNIILVGHSGTTIVAAGVADRMPERVAHLVYLDGFVPANGLSYNDLGDKDWQAWVLSNVTENEYGKVFNLPDVRNFGWIEETDCDWFNAKVTPHPLKMGTDPLILHNEPAFADIPRTCITCIGDTPGGNSSPEWAAGMNFRELHASHLAMISAPQVLADMLLELATYT